MCFARKFKIVSVVSFSKQYPHWGELQRMHRLRVFEGDRAGKCTDCGWEGAAPRHDDYLRLNEPRDCRGKRPGAE